MKLEVFKGFDLEDIIIDFESFRAVRAYRDAKGFELILKSLDQAGSLKDDNIILIGQDAYLIENFGKYKNPDNEARYEVTGRHINCLLERRAVISYVVSTAMTYEAQIYRIVNENFINPTDPDRVLPGLINAASKGFTETPTESYEIKNKSALEIIREFAETADLGFRIIFDPDNQQFIFEVYKGEDKTNDVFFSEEFSNVADVELTKRTEDYRNIGYLDNNGVITQIGTASGIDRREYSTSGDDIGNVLEELQRRKQIISANGQILNTNQFIYKDDWDLGDTVSFEDKQLGFNVERPVLEVTETYTNQLEIEAVFGDKIPSIIEIIKKGR